jgi:hypothetical protein
MHENLTILSLSLAESNIEHRNKLPLPACTVARPVNGSTRIETEFFFRCCSNPDSRSFVFNYLIRVLCLTYLTYLPTLSRICTNISEESFAAFFYPEDGESSEMLLRVCRTTQHHISEHYNVNTRCP